MFLGNNDNIDSKPSAARTVIVAVTVAIVIVEVTVT